MLGILAGMRESVLILLLLMSGCDGTIYGRDGVTDGDTFYLAPIAMASQDPVLQSWVRYSLAKSVCQLEIEAEIPSRAGSFECELTARRLLLQAWDEKTLSNQDLEDSYLDELRCVNDAGFLAEYIAHHFGKPEWVLPDGLRPDEFRDWQKTNLPRHKPLTRLIGYWGYAD